MTVRKTETGRSSAREPKTLLITESFLPKVGGTITWFDNVYRRYPRRSVWIATQSYGDTRKLDRSYSGGRISRTRFQRYRFLKPESLLLYAKMFIMCLWLVLRRRIDVVHAGKVLPEGFVALWLKRLLRRPYLVYAHGEEITIFNSNPAYRKVVPKVYNGASLIIANSSFTRDLLIDVGVDARRIAQVSPGVDTDHFQLGPKDEDLLEQLDLREKTVLLSVGRLTERKGHERVIEALPMVLHKRPDVVYVIASTGEEEMSLRQLAIVRGVSGMVRFVGEVTYEKLPAYYNTADIFILANRTLPGGDVEGFGIVFLEANACGKPVIAGASGGTGDPVRDGHNGLRIDAADPEAIADAVLKLARNKNLRKRMGENGRRLILDEYTWNAVCAKIRGLSEAVARRESPLVSTRSATGTVRER